MEEKRGTPLLHVAAAACLFLLLLLGEAGCRWRLEGCGGGDRWRVLAVELLQQRGKVVRAGGAMGGSLALEKGGLALEGGVLSQGGWRWGLCAGVWNGGLRGDGGKL